MISWGRMEGYGIESTNCVPRYEIIGSWDGSFELRKIDPELNQLGESKYFRRQGDAKLAAEADRREEIARTGRP